MTEHYELSLSKLYYKLCENLVPLMNYAMYDCFGGPHCIPLNWVINSQKCGTFFFVLFLMIYFQNFSLTMWVYLALHGTYGMIWFFKDTVFPDKGFQQMCTIGSAIACYVIILLPYWVSPVLIASGYTQQPPYILIWFAITLHTLGVMIMMVSDAQKYYVLKIKKGLITDGMFRYVRHPNYTGEMMIYFSYAVLSMHPLPFLILLYVWSIVFATRIVYKEQSMSRHKEWNSYVAETNYLLPIKVIEHFYRDLHIKYI
ncbi:hypothetical protein WA158_007834 [Blastocystis sp. Blastoise]